MVRPQTELLASAGVPSQGYLPIPCIRSLATSSPLTLPGQSNCEGFELTLFQCLHFSRNALLSDEDKQRAPCIYQALQWAQQAAASRTALTASTVREEVASRITACGGQIDYVEVRSALCSLGEHFVTAHVCSVSYIY